MTPSETVPFCSHNNALWCDAVLKAAGAKTSFHSGYWVAYGKPLPLYPNIVTLTKNPHADLNAALKALPTHSAVKDSFDCLALKASGFKKLFTGTWLFRPAQNARRQPVSSDWQKAVTLGGMRNWLAAWNENKSLHQVLSPELLKSSAVDFASVSRDDHIRAGCIFNHGPPLNGKNLVGVSNVFHRKKWLYGGLRELLQPFPHRPICTYETDQDLIPVYRQLGFQQCGNLAIWLKTGA